MQEWRQRNERDAQDLQDQTRAQMMARGPLGLGTIRKYYILSALFVAYGILYCVRWHLPWYVWVAIIFFGSKYVVRGVRRFLDRFAREGRFFDHEGRAAVLLVFSLLFLFCAYCRHSAKEDRQRSSDPAAVRR